MAYYGTKMGGGLNLKADTTSIPDSSLTACRYCAFDTVGAVTSGRGRSYANNGSVIAAYSILGGFDGLSSSLKYRFFKTNSEVYTNTTTSTALDDSTNLSATYTTAVSTLAPRVLGLTAPTWGATGNLSGFTYSGYAYLADGSTTQRLKLTTGAPPTVARETWGLQSPGYHEITGTTPLAASGTTVTLTVTGGHGIRSGLAAAPAYPFGQNIEFVGFSKVANIPESEINGLHSDYSGSGVVDVTVTTDGTTLDAGSTYTITFGGQYEYTNVPQIDKRDGGSLANLGGGGDYQTGTTTEGSSTTNEVQTLFKDGGTVTSGYFRLRFTNPSDPDDFEVTEPLAYNATHTEVQTALRNLALIGDGNSVTSLGVCSVTADTTITFATTTTANGDTPNPGGGSIGFIRQGPTLTRTASSGGLVGGTYYYAYTFYNGVAESNFSARIPIYATTDDSVTLTNVLLGPAGTTERRIYRTDVNGRQLYYIGKIENNTANTYIDTAKIAAGADYNAQPGDAVDYAENPAGDSDKQSSKKQASKRGVQEAQAKAKAAEEKKREKLATNLGLLSDWTDHDYPPANLKHVGLVGDTAFGITGSELAFSQSGNVEHWPLSNRVKPGRNTSETLRAWVPFDRDVIMYTHNGLYRLSQVGLSFDDSRFEEIETPVGLAGEWAVAALDGQQGHLFLAKSGLYLFDGARVNEIGQAIEPMFTDSSNADYINPLYMSSAVMVTSRDRMMLFYATTSGGNNRMLWGDFQDPGNPSFAVYDWAATSAWRERADNYIVAGDSSGYVYVNDSGWADANGTVDWELTTKEFQLNEGKAFAVDEVVLDADFAGVSTTVTVTTRGRGSTKNCAFTNTTTGRQRIKLKCPTYMRGEVAKVSISSSSDTKRVLYGVGFTFLPSGEP